MCNKKVLIPIIFLLILFFNMSISFADDVFPENYNDFNYWVVYQVNEDRVQYDGLYKFVGSKYPITVTLQNGELKSHYLLSPNKRYTYNNGQWSLSAYSDVDNGPQDPGQSYTVSSRTILYANHDIKLYNSETVFFYRQVPKFPKISSILTHHQPLTLMSPPIRGIVVYLIGLIVISAAFYKGLQFLFRTLQKG